jgi:hypothetical protein
MHLYKDRAKFKYLQKKGYFRLCCAAISDQIKFESTAEGWDIWADDCAQSARRVRSGEENAELYRIRDTPPRFTD